MEGFAVRVYKEQLTFCSAHFLLFADGTRERLHGHNYRVSVELTGSLDEIGVVVDFMKLKPIVKALCDDLDHRTLIPSENTWLTLREDADSLEIIHGQERFLIPRRDLVLLPIPNSSVEHMARYLCDRLTERLFEELPSSSITSVLVELEESRGQSAIYRRTLDA